MIEPIKEVPPEDDRPSGAGNVFSLLFDALTSVEFALVLVVLLAGACITGTLLPQGGEVAQYLQKNPAGAQRMAVLTSLGLTHVFSASWFIALLCALSASLTACSTRRFAAILRTTGALRGRAVASLMTHTSMLLILVGAVIRGGWGEKGHIEFREGQTVSRFVADNGDIALPFAVHLVKFEVETYAEAAQAEAAKGGGPEAETGRLVVLWPEKDLSLAFPAEINVERVVTPKDEAPGADTTYRLKVVRYVPDFTMDTTTREVTSRSDTPRNPAIQVVVEAGDHTNTYWLFSKHPGFNMGGGGSHGGPRDPLEMAYQRQDRPSEEPQIKAFRSTLAFLEGGTVATQRTIAVNAPFTRKGYTFYQSGYNAADPSWTSLQVVRDPGVPVVYTGFALMIVGLFALFYLYGKGEPMTLTFDLALVVYFAALVCAVVNLFRKSGLLSAIETGLLSAGAVAQTVYMGLRWFQAGRAPFSNMFESLFLFGWAMVAVYLVLRIRVGKIPGLGAATALLALMTLAYASTYASDIKPLMPALQSNWLTFHVFSCFLGYGGFAVSFLAAIGYLVAARDGSPARPELRDALESALGKTVAFGFLFLTVGIITGAVWANSAWGTYWSWDPKETWSLITWFIYAIFLHCRFMRGWRGKSAAWISVIGFLSVLFTYVGVNFLMSGLHSYARGQ